MFEKIFKARSRDVLAAEEAQKAANELLDQSQKQNRKLDEILHQIRVIAARMEQRQMNITGPRE